MGFDIDALLKPEEEKALYKSAALFRQSANACVVCGVNDGDTDLCCTPHCNQNMHKDCATRCIMCHRVVCEFHRVRVGEEMHCEYCAVKAKAELQEQLEQAEKERLDQRSAA